MDREDYEWEKRLAEMRAVQELAAQKQRHAVGGAISIDWEREMANAMASQAYVAAKANVDAKTATFIGPDSARIAEAQRDIVGGLDNSIQNRNQPVQTSSRTVTFEEQWHRWRIEQGRKLASQRAALLTYLQSKLEADDMHAVQDAASDIREIDAKLSVLKG